VDLQKADISSSDPEFHKREGTLMSSCNATQQDFEYVIASGNNGIVNPLHYITHRANFNRVKDVFLPGCSRLMA
jgi:threonine dehydrogenase-like Zn-dependent dehydrogenase